MNFFKGHDFSIKTGQLIVTTQQLADDLKITKIMAYRKLILLQEYGVIILEPQSHCCIVTIFKYEDYQGKTSKIDDDYVFNKRDEYYRPNMKKMGKKTDSIFGIF